MVHFKLNDITISLFLIIWIQDCFVCSDKKKIGNHCYLIKITFLSYILFYKNSLINKQGIENQNCSLERTFIFL